MTVGGSCATAIRWLTEVLMSVLKALGLQTYRPAFTFHVIDSHVRRFWPSGYRNPGFNFALSFNGFLGHI
jgi:hypothetical protein|nr:hypothetical protein Q903MT_gene2181 [Picea sitchensis]